MMNPTMFDPIALAAWYSDENNDSLLQTELEHYLQNYFPCFSLQPQRRLFQTFIQGLLSPLERKSIEPVALHFSGEKYELLSRQIGAGCGMLSVDDTSFVKKGKHSAGVKRQYCGCLGKTENCQSGVFLACAGDKGYGLVDYELYIPKEWFSGDYSKLREECHIPEEKTFATKNQIAQRMLNQVIKSGRFQVQWVGCDAAYGNDHGFLDGLELPEGVWYFAATNAKEQVFLEYPQQSFPETKRGRPRKHPVLSNGPTSVRDIAEDPSLPWETVVLAEGAKGPIIAERKFLRCFSCRADGSRNYVKPGDEIWLYLRKYAGDEIKYFVSNAPADLPVGELDRAATLRWPIEQCFEECKSNLGMGDYECRSYQGWNRHMLFVMITHLFATQIREIFKKKQSR